jgi:hypothetical protein
VRLFSPIIIRKKQICNKEAQLAKYIDREYSYSEVKARSSDGQRHVTITATGLASSS